MKKTNVQSAITALALILLVLTGCKGTNDTLQEILIDQGNPTITANTQLQFTAKAKFSDGMLLNWTLLTWASSSNAVATINMYGVATAHSYGITTITATDEYNKSIVGTATLTVEPVASLSISPPNPFIVQGVYRQLTVNAQLTPSGATQNVTSYALWTSSSDSVAVAGNFGIIRTVAQGSATISAQLTTDATYTGTTLLTVTAAPLSSITLTTSPPLPLLVIPPSTQTSISSIALWAWGTLADSTTLDMTKSVTWSSSDTTIAYINNSPGYEGIVTAQSITGTCTITAVDPMTGIAGSTVLTVQ